VNFKNTVNEPFQLEVEKNVKVPADFRVKSASQKFKRYWTPTIEAAVPQYFEAKERKNREIRCPPLFTFCVLMGPFVSAEFQQSYLTHLFERFNSTRDWALAVKVAAELDCLLSLALCSQVLAPACRPEFVDVPATSDPCSSSSSQQPFIEAVGLRHPCVRLLGETPFIPNDIALGGTHHSTIILTGPNMGGKSTLLRQACISVILAQLGCHVPATSFKLSPVDRIFTRIGANDNILGGQSTFMVELDETAKILRHATPRSLVILDELGRGTSTHDGFAIAYSVLHHLVTHIGCRGLFSTHYHLLPLDFAPYPGVGLYHMAYELDERSRQVVFLYKLREGGASSSHGMNVATMAGVPAHIVEQAEAISRDFHQQHFGEGSKTAAAVREQTLPATSAADFAELMSSVGRQQPLTSELKILLSQLQNQKK